MLTGQCLLTDVSGIQLSKIYTIRETFISYIAACFLSAQYKSIGRRKRRTTTIRRTNKRQRETARGQSTSVTLSSMIYNYTSLCYGRATDMPVVESCVTLPIFSYSLMLDIDCGRIPFRFIGAVKPSYSVDP